MAIIASAAGRWKTPRAIASELPALREALVGRFDAQHALIVAEIGTDMSRFPSARQLASWAGQCPGNDRSAGKRRSGKPATV